MYINTLPNITLLVQIKKCITSKSFDCVTLQKLYRKAQLNEQFTNYLLMT